MCIVQCENMTVVERKLKEMGIEYVQNRVEEGGIYVDQLFFHDPDGFMIEICNCENLPVVYLDGEPAGAVCSRRSFKKHQQPPPSPQMVKCVTAVSVKEDYLSCAGFYREGSNC
uniref:Lactoylglutathione lyase-like n=1 Tax=Nelumbo nucifera TaxID=4432 RepID=A0A822ZFA6_NELNU|nr:TPA_asm: hypothetical protein HUJ06_003104 [Nelumbo nucifera]